MAKAPIGDYEVLDPNGKPVVMASLWRERPAVLGFVRHFGCLFCHEQVTELRERESEIEERGARLVIVGNGRPEHAQGFAERTNMHGKVFTDPSRATYRALGMRGGVVNSLRFELFSNALRAYRNGHRQQRVQGDPWQQGGAIVVRPDGTLEYAYISRTAGDHPTVREILTVLDRMRRA
ncbi:MAG: AhpC/TSA family protein [Myxococcales bacterium]|nr:AhpC/TSA family protein [Myxococcales bacterium]MCB9576404.1 AhpC/TSA family protein [Polyangiaceae bacterium]